MALTDASIEATQQTDQMLSKDTDAKKFVHEGREYPDTPYFRDMVARMERQKEEGPGTFKEAAQTIAEVAPITGDAIAMYELPEDMKNAFALIKQGYSEGDIKDMGLGAGYAALTAAGVVPGLGMGARVLRKGLRASLDDAVEQTGDLFRTASGMDDTSGLITVTDKSVKITKPPKSVQKGPAIFKFFGGDKGISSDQKYADYAASKKKADDLGIEAKDKATFDDKEEFIFRDSKGTYIDHVDGKFRYEIGTADLKLADGIQDQRLMSFPIGGKPINKDVSLSFLKLENAKRKAAVDAGFDPQDYELNDPIKLPDLLNDHKVFEEYPFLRNIVIRRAETGPDLVPLYEGAYKPASMFSNDVIFLNTNNTAENFKSIIAHEVQHAIDFFEGRQSGADLDILILATLKEKKLIDPDINDIDEAIDIFNQLDDEISSEVYEEASKKYTTVAGEVDARNVEFRLKNPNLQFKELPTRFTDEYAPEGKSLAATKDYEEAVESQKIPNLERQLDTLEKLDAEMETLKNTLKEIENEKLTSSPGDLTDYGYVDIKPKSAQTRQDKTSEAIPVMPVNQASLTEKGFDFKPGGEFVNPITKEILTGKKVGNANIKIVPGMEVKGGRPMASFNVTDLDVPEVGTTGKGKSQILVNLIKPTKKGNKAGWKWDNVGDEELEGVNTLVSVVHKGKHYFTLETDFSKGAELKTYPKSKSEPRLRPTATGELDLQEEVGKIRMKDKTHPVYRKITAFASGGLAMAEGGAIPMDRQMSMFEDGGLMDEGGTIDPVSGNDVPPGSTQEEVRDDIPAQLSEGEFVFPADVVRYIGLGNLMRMRQEAKMGLKLMEEMGQMGNSEEATMPDDLPFDINDLDMDDDPVEMQEGGVVTSQDTGIFRQPSQFAGEGNRPGVAPAPVVPPMGAIPQAASAQMQRPQTYAVPTVQQQNIPTTPFTQFTGGVPNVEFEMATFRNEQGQEIQLKIKKGTKGELFDPADAARYAGYKYVDPEATKAADTTVQPTTPQTTRVTGVEGMSKEEREAAEETTLRSKQRIQDSRNLFGLETVEGVMEGIGGTLGTYGPDSVGKMTGTGYIIGKNGQLLDPSTGLLVRGGDTGITSPFALISGITDPRYQNQKPFNADFMNALPDNVKGRFVNNLRSNPAYFSERFKNTTSIAEVRDSIQKADDFEKNFKDKGFVINRDGSFTAKPGASDAEKAAAAAAVAAYAESMSEPEYDDDADDGTFNRLVRESMLSKQRKSSVPKAAAQRQQYRQSTPASGPPSVAQTVRDMGSFETPSNRDDTDRQRGGGQSFGKGKDPSGDAGSGGYSPFKQGGLASKPKPKAKKKMKRGGLASKK